MKSLSVGFDELSGKTRILRWTLVIVAACIAFVAFAAAPAAFATVTDDAVENATMTTVIAKDDSATENDAEAGDGATTATNDDDATSDDVAASRDAATTANDDGVAVYRLYNRWDGSHVITRDANERWVLALQGWKDEGAAFVSPASGIEVHRLYNSHSGDHFYTADANERTVLTRIGWTYEGVGFYASPTPTDYGVYRVFNPHMTDNGGRGAHLWTVDRTEYQHLDNVGWNGEGLKWYATGPGDPSDQLVLPTPLAHHGALRVDGANLVDQNGRPFQLRGVSTHGIAWFPQYVDRATFQTLRDDWGANCVRLAMYSAEYNGYSTGGDREWLKSLVRAGVNEARDLGMYAIVDWHVLNDQSPTVYEGDARAFFDQMSREFAPYDNVIYEICNEPNGWADWNTIKGYAERVIPVIRANDPDAVIIVGTPNWSQFVDQAAASRLTGEVGRNVMYALHFYAGTHGKWLQDRLIQAHDAGLPIFISEFGSSTADGQSGFYQNETAAWLDLADRYGISWMMWSLCNKNEAASMIQPWCAKTSSWSEGELTDSGRWLRARLRAAAGL